MLQGTHPARDSLGTLLPDIVWGSWSLLVCQEEDAVTKSRVARTTGGQGGPARSVGILVTIHGAKPGADRPGEQMIRTDRRHGLVGICLSLSADVACVKASDIDHSVGSDELALALSPAREAPGGPNAPCRR